MLKLMQVLLLICLTSVISLVPAQAQQPLAQSQEIKPGETPAGLSSTQWGSIQSQIAAGKYRAYPRPDGDYVSSNPAHGWQIHYAADGTTTLTPRDSNVKPYHLGMKLSAIGYQTLQPLDKPQQISSKEHTLTYQWNGHLQERWVNSENDLEQWFILDQRPQRVDDVISDQPLTVQLSVDSELKVIQKGNAIHFNNAHGTAITYNKLKVWDAKGRIVASRMKLDGNVLSLLINDAGAVYPLTIDPSFQQQALLKASNTDVGDTFGDSVAISGNTLVVGAWREDSKATGVNGDQSDNSASGAGAVYVFTRTGTTWSQQAYLKASNTEALDFFGWSVAISGDTLVVGTPYETSKATGVNGDQADNSVKDAGAAYVFIRTGTVWSQQAYLKASNTAPSAFFGWSVDISGDTVVVGAQNEHSIVGNSGAAYVFNRTGNVWSQQAFLKASNAGFLDRFGISVAISGDTLVVGAYFESSKATGVNGDQNDNSANHSGAAYVFTRTGSTWSQQAYLKASNTDADDQFGWSVAISGETVVVGAQKEDSNATGVNGNQDNNSAENAGAAYVFTRTGSTWSQQAYLKTSNTEALDHFGSSVAISGDLLVVPLPFKSEAPVFARTGINWNQQVILKACCMSDTIAIAGNTVVVGNVNQQLVYVFVLPNETLDIDGDGKAKPLTDGLLLIRFLFGFRDNTLIDNAVDPAATRTTAVQIQPYIQAGVDSKIWDIDGDGSVKPLTDGLLVIRYLFGFTGNTLIDNAVDPAATRKTASAIEAYFQSIKP